jgi:galactonate dehydratase
MIITGVEAFPVVNPNPYVGGPAWMFVRLETDTGIRGYGEIFATQSYLRLDTFAKVVEEVAEDFLIGADPTEIESVYQRYYNSFYSHAPDLLKMAVFSGLEVACWDILGKAVQKPVHDLLGGRVRPSVRTYTYISAPADRAGDGFDFWLDPGAVAERACDLVDQGFTGLKLDPFPLLTGSDSHASQFVPLQFSLDALDLAAETLAAIRGLIGKRADIIVRTHGQMTASAALRVAGRIEQFDPLWFEEPVPPELPEEMALVARGTRLPITAGERLTSKSEFARLIRHQAASIFNLDISQVGGLWEAKKIAAMAEANFVQVAPHVYGGPLVGAASMHFGLTAPNLLIMEGMGKFDGAHAELLTHRLDWRDGYLHPNGRPGIGHDLNEDVARSWAPKKSDRLWGSRGSTAPISDPARV